MQILSFVLINKYGCWSHERTHSIDRYVDYASVHPSSRALVGHCSSWEMAGGGGGGGSDISLASSFHNGCATTTEY